MNSSSFPKDGSCRGRTVHRGRGGVMAGRIRQEDVDTVRERTDIVQVVSQYLQLKKASRDSLTGLCPFHAEKTPSFSVSPSKQAYYCFGCGEGGGVFLFLEKIENLSFSEAVEKLAAEAGITLRHEGQTAAGRYLAERGITAESIERFGIGYAPGYPDFLLKRMTSSYAPELLVEAGLAAPDSSGGLRDRFRGRVMFPIQDLAGNAVGFGGRLLP